MSARARARARESKSKSESESKSKSERERERVPSANNVRANPQVPRIPEHVEKPFSKKEKSHKSVPSYMYSITLLQMLTF